MTRVLLAISIIVVMSGCAIYPEDNLQPSRLMTIGQAYPNLEAMAPPAAFADSSRVTTYQAPFEDVFRIASVTASQVQFYVEDTQKSRGVILASRSAMMQPKGTMSGHLTTEHQYYYAILVRELGPKRTEVRISSKVQGKCAMWHGSMHVASLGTLSSQIVQDNERCEKLSKGMWASGAQTSVVEMQQFHTFLRNGLIAAGLI